MRNLWPNDIAVVAAVDTKPPVAILREQAALLGQSTQNLVEAQVAEGQQSVTLADGMVQVARRIRGEYTQPSRRTIFVYDFFITAPSLYYKYRAFTIQHNIDLYPVQIDADEDIHTEITPEGAERIIEAASETEFMEILGRIFATEKIRHVIGALLTQIDVVAETA